MATDLNKSAEWLDDAIIPAREVHNIQVRGLSDFPVDVTPGARQVAQLTAWRSAQVCAVPEIIAALRTLKETADWAKGFFVADKLDFDWKTAPFKTYASFEDFYETELAETWGDLEDLIAISEELARGKLEPDAAGKKALRNGAERRAAAELARKRAKTPKPKEGRPSKGETRDQITSFKDSRGTSSAYLLLRLADESPKTLAAYEEGKFSSVRAAARAGGVLKPKPPNPKTEAARLLKWGDAYWDALAAAVAELRSKRSG